MILALFIASLIPAAPLPRVEKSGPDAALTALFRTREGWVGGDGAYSVPLPDERTLWLFSDTWVGRIREGKRRDVVLVNNTVGIQTGSGADSKLSFHIEHDRAGKPRAIFTPPDGKGWFWQFAGHQARGSLHVFLPRFEKASGPAAFGFRGIDMWLGTVSNPDAAPTEWKVRYAKLPFADVKGERKRSYGSAVLTVGDHVYIYGYEENPGKPFPSRCLLVARAPKDHLDDFDQWRFHANGKWQSNAAAATSSVGGLATEFSVSYLPGLDRYVLVCTENGLSDRIIGRFSRSPEGPWSGPVLLHECQEMKQDRKLFCYAAKAHPRLAGTNELVISYVVNSFELGPVLDNAELYWPIFVRVRLK
jgi:hypothetical protein